MSNEASSTNTANVPENSRTKAFDDERKYLGGLLKDRINFHLVFSSLFLLGALRLDKSIDIGFQLAILSAGTFVSVFICAAVVRTHSLVELALKEIAKDSSHPYTELKDKARLKDANQYLVWVPVVLTSLFLFLTMVIAWQYLNM